MLTHKQTRALPNTHAPPSLPSLPSHGAAVIPIHHSAYSDNTKLQEDANASNSKLMKLTIASLHNGSPMFW